MAKFRVVGIVTGSKYLGEFEAPDEDTAVEMALNSNAAHVGLCHQCSEHCEDPSIDSATAEKVSNG